tara:strand:+ start:16075 stop:16755 length:681 start_codon:yes stop_codon:yes gene_type:complete
MRILGIDTSSPKGSIAITLKNKIISEKAISGNTSYSKNLFFIIDSILQDTNLSISQIDAFAVSIGPGSFTGLRVGLSSVLGFSLAQTKPVVSVETLLAMAHTIPFTNNIICPIIDARKGELYTSFFQYNENGQICRLGEDRTVKPDLLLNEINKTTLFFGSGVDAYGRLLCEKLKNLAVFDNGSSNTTAASVAKLAFEKTKKGEKTDSAQLKPKYVRRSEAEMNFN